MARLLVDEGISRDLVAAIVAQGGVAFHALDTGPKGQHDTVLFHEAQRRQLTIFTLNRAHFLLLAEAWQVWGMGDHYGLIVPKPGPQPSNQILLLILQRFCQDSSLFVNRIEFF
jgi:hypothetical protein